ncbi:MAG: anaerobic ribonucleoside-triphosphate reductase activating protein [bacterium]|nr:anaerobic ribonucleoside-triphosphate reductase activating protein [bacterium]
MEIKGFIESSLVDWDGKITCVIFLPNCNLRCPFCYNHPLIFHPEEIDSIPFSRIASYLKEKRDWIDGVVVTGGEPLIHSGLQGLIKEIKDLGFLVKIDTNGTNPRSLKEMIDKKLIDYVAVDIKAPLNERYRKVTNSKVDIGDIKRSIDILMNSGIDYEFRTTVVPTLLTVDAMEEIAKQISGAKRYVLQQFLPENAMDEGLRGIKPYNKEEMGKILKVVSKYVRNSSYRGK